MNKTGQNGNSVQKKNIFQKKIKIKLSFGKILGLLFAVIAVIYLSFSVHVFSNFIRILVSDPEAAKGQGAAAAEALDEIYMEDDE